MKINNLQKDLVHRKVCARANYLHKVFAKLCPSTPNLSEEELGGRLKAFSKLLSLNKIDFRKNGTLEEFKQISNIKSRSGRKKFLDSLVALNLLYKDEKKGIYQVTPESEKIWKSLIYLVEDVPSYINQKEKFSYCKYYYFKINTDGESYCDLFINQSYKNFDYQILKVFNASAGSETPLYTFKLLGHSDNIESYQITQEEPIHKSFKLFLKNPAKIGDDVNIWYRYEWPGMFLNSWKEWDYSLTIKEPIKLLIFHIILPKEHMINEESFCLNQTDLQKDSKKIGEFINHEPIVLENSDNKEIIWKIENVPSNVTTRIGWTHS
ncbi:MAG: hypothetical protein ABIH63_00460 [archaeon]